jgi:hypothetical protein
MRAWVSVWLWNSKRPARDRESISSQERNAPSPFSRAMIVSGVWRRASTSSQVGGKGPGREGTRPGTRNTIPFMPYRRIRGWPMLHRLPRPSSKVRTTAFWRAGRVPISNWKYWVAESET